MPLGQVGAAAGRRRYAANSLARRINNHYGTLAAFRARTLLISDELSRIREDGVALLFGIARELFRFRTAHEPDLRIPDLDGSISGKAREREKEKRGARHEN